MYRTLDQRSRKIAATYPEVIKRRNKGTYVGLVTYMYSHTHANIAKQLGYSKQPYCCSFRACIGTFCSQKRAEAVLPQCG